MLAVVVDTLACFDFTFHCTLLRAGASIQSAWDSSGIGHSDARYSSVCRRARCQYVLTQPHISVFVSALVCFAVLSFTARGVCVCTEYSVERQIHDNDDEPIYSFRTGVYVLLHFYAPAVCTVLW